MECATKRLVDTKSLVASSGFFGRPRFFGQLAPNKPEAAPGTGPSKWGQLRSSFELVSDFEIRISASLPPSRPRYPAASSEGTPLSKPRVERCERREPSRNPGQEARSTHEPRRGGPMALSFITLRFLVRYSAVHHAIRATPPVNEPHNITPPPPPRRGTTCQPGAQPSDSAAQPRPGKECSSNGAQPAISANGDKARSHAPPPPSVVNTDAANEPVPGCLGRHAETRRQNQRS